LIRPIASSLASYCAKDQTKSSSISIGIKLLIEEDIGIVDVGLAMDDFINKVKLLIEQNIVRKLTTLLS
jgi:hypothetical protein